MKEKNLSCPVKPCLTSSIEKVIGIERYTSTEVNLDSLRREEICGSKLWFVEMRNEKGKIEVPLNVLKLSPSQQEEIMKHNKKVKKNDFLSFTLQKSNVRGKEMMLTLKKHK